MQTKLLFVILALHLVLCYGAELRKIPKLYNALITTDENLTSSRTYPVIQPTLHEYGVSYPYGYHPLDYRALRVPAVYPQYQGHYNRPNIFFSPQYMQRPLEAEPQPYEPTETTDPMPQAKEQMPATDTAATAQNEIKTDETNKEAPSQQEQPASLGDKNFFRAFYPLPPQGPGSFNPYHLPPLPYQPFPAVYNPYNRQREFFLPPYNYLPKPQSYPTRAPYPQIPQNSATPDQEAAAMKPSLPTANVAPAEPQSNNFDNIKNGSPNKASNIPDVPPPPLPSGGVKAQDTLADETQQQTASAATNPTQAEQDDTDTVAAP